MPLGAVRMILLEAIAQNLKTIAAGVAAGDPRVMGRVLRSFAQLRRTMEPEVLKALLEDWVRSWSLGGVSLLETWYKYIQLLMSEESTLLKPSEPFHLHKRFTWNH